METTLLQPYQLLGAIYAGLIIGLTFSVLRLFIPKNRAPFKFRISAALIDALFYIASTAVAAWALIRFSDGQIRFFMLLTMALAALLCIKTAGRLLYVIFRRE